MKNHFYLLVALLTPALLSAQVNVDYNDVGVIVNDNSQTSVSIANYFQQQRNIPDENMIHITAPTIEEISDEEFETMRNQIENYLTANNLEDQLNYLVTTKGVPLKVDRGGCYNNMTFINCSSVDSELSLILSDASDQVGLSGSIANPYFNANMHFSRENQDIYLVTRLDAYTETAVIDMIDRSGPNTAVNQETSNIVLDISSADNNDTDLFYSLFMEDVQNLLEMENWNIIYHPDSNILLNAQKVFGYSSVNPNTENTELNLAWERGSISNSIYSFTAPSFNSQDNTNNDIWIADLIEGGATGAHGVTYYIYASQSVQNETLFDYYTNTDDIFNLAESYYLALPRLSWQSVIVGDPKSSIIIDNTLSFGNPELVEQLRIFPNPNNGSFLVETNDLAVKQIKVINQLGQLIHSLTPETGRKSTPIDIEGQAAGIYYVVILSDEGRVVEKIVVEK